MIVIFYETITSGSSEVGRVSYTNGQLKIQNAELEVGYLLEGIDHSNGRAVEAALRQAPLKFDGAYLRAEVQE